MSSKHSQFVFSFQKFQNEIERNPKNKSKNYWNPIMCLAFSLSLMREIYFDFFREVPDTKTIKLERQVMIF